MSEYLHNYISHLGHLAWMATDFFFWKIDTELITKANAAYSCCQADTVSLFLSVKKKTQTVSVYVLELLNFMLRLSMWINNFVQIICNRSTMTGIVTAASVNFWVSSINSYMLMICWEKKLFRKCEKGACGFRAF